ncbi:carboxypeptidase-like regulatory domain-containing protein [Methanobrevibacter sp.]|uniref:carboxypeptidase-like regulatory domain-containing protein n=1 Tax=Methanobrevibacter sp. TaxID=66852 RepID=UPI003890FF42
MNSFFNKKKTIYTRNDVKLINLTEIGLPVKLNVDNIEKYYDYENIKIIAKLTDDDLNPLSYETIKLEINNVTYSRSTNKTGHALFSIKLDAGFYNVTTYLQNSAEYEDCIVNSTVLIKSTIISSDVYNDTKFSVKLLDSFGNNLTNVGINFYVDGNYYTSGITDDNGNIEINFYLPEGKYLIECKNTFTLEKKANYIQIFNKTIILANNVVKYFGGNEKFNIEIFKNDKTPIDNAKIKILINGQPYTRTTDNNGKASMAINLDSGVYNVTTDYGGLKVYSTVTVKSTISANDFTKIFRNATQYYGTFVDSQGNLLKNTKVIFNINGVFYERTTNDNGVAKLNINLNPGTYILTATNPVNGENHATTITVLPNIIENHDLTKYYKNASQYVIKVLDDQGNPVSGQSVDFNINGVFYTRTSNATGHVKMNINLNPGTYIITALYKGFMASNTITVKPILEANDLSMKFCDGSKFEAKLLDGEGNSYSGQKITFNINGVFYDRTTDVNGIARLNINLNPGDYIITSSYNGLNIANTIRITPDPMYYTIGSNPLDYNYYMNEYNKFSLDWYYIDQYDSNVKTIYDIYGNMGMELQNVRYGTKYICYEASTLKEIALNSDGEVISWTIARDYGEQYILYDQYNNIIARGHWINGEGIDQYYS